MISHYFYCIYFVRSKTNPAAVKGRELHKIANIPRWGFLGTILEAASYKFYRDKLKLFYMIITIPKHHYCYVPSLLTVKKNMELKTIECQTLNFSSR